MVHGAYDRTDISELAKLYQINRWLIPSIWPETFSFATHDCLATGLPVMCFDLGGQGDAVRAHPNGHVLPFGPGRDPTDDLVQAVREQYQTVLA